MSTMERLVAAAALLLFAAFSLVLPYYVPEVDLTITILIVVAMAGYDFWLNLWRPARRSGDR